MFTLEPEDLVPYWRVIDRDMEAIDVHLATAKPIVHYVVFHCQQAVEKMLKLLLVVANTDYPHTHDIAHLVKLLPGDHTLRPLFQPFLAWSVYAVAPRYDLEIEVNVMNLPSVAELKEWRQSLDVLYQKVQEFVKCQV